jgi:methyl-accepting chemotaxis protein
MDALGSDLSALATLTGQDENGAAAWLEGMKNAANGLNSSDVDAWDKLLTKLAEGTPGAGNLLTFSDIYKTAEAMGVAETTYVELDGKMVSLTEANGMYLESLKQLVQVYPELNDMINTETGEIKGGNTALEERIEAITKEHENEVLLYALKQKRLALEKKFSELPTLRLDAAMAQNAVEAMQKDYDKALERLKELGAYLTDSGNWEIADISKQGEVIEIVENVIDKYDELVDAAEAAKKAYEDQQSAYDQASAKYDEYEKSIDNVTESTKQATQATKEYSDEAKKAAADGVQALGDALKEVNDYAERTKKSTADSIDSALKGFKNFQLAADHIKELEKNQKSTTDENGMLVGVDDTVPSLNKMKDALDKQAAFMDEYRQNLATAQAKGISEDLLAEFASDFSQESADFLHLIANASPQDLEAFKSSYKKMAEAKEPLTKSLTEMKLQADDEFNELVAKAKEAAINLNNGEIAKESMASTVQGIAEGIRSQVDNVGSAVDALNAELERLGSFDDYNVFGGLSGAGISFKFGVDGEHANGLDYVPFDNYLAYLHEGESILTAEEAAMWRNFKSGGSNLRNTIDYGQLSGAIWDNAPNMGGNVYLDGRTVGKVISAQQANSYRQLERSGWQG